MKKVLFYTPGTEERSRQLQKLTEDAGDISFRRVAETEAGQMIGWLAGREGFVYLPLAQAAAPAEEILLLDGFEEEELRSFLYYLRSRFFAVKLKAVVTGYNAAWRLGDLALALEEEHRALHPGGPAAAPGEKEAPGTRS